MSLFCGYCEVVVPEHCGCGAKSLYKKYMKLIEENKKLKGENDELKLLLKEACEYLQRETDLGKETANTYGVDSKMFGYYEFLNKPEVKKIIGGSDD